MVFVCKTHLHVYQQQRYFKKLLCFQNIKHWTSVKVKD